jgi:MFS family permease
MRLGLSRLTVLIGAITFLDIALWSAVTPLLPRWQHELGASKADAGLIVGAYSGAVLIASLPIGHLSDRVGTRRMTVASTLVFACTFPLLGLADATWQLILVRFLQGLCSAVSWTAGVAWLSSAGDPSRRGASLGVVNAGASVAAMAGPAIGGPLVGAIGLLPTMLALSGVMLVLFLGTLAEPEPPGEEEPEHGSLRAAAGAARRSRKLRAAFAGILYVSLASGALQVLAPLHLGNTGLSQSQIGLVFTFSAALASGVTLGVGILSDRIDRVRATVVLIAVLAIELSLFALGVSQGGYIGLIAIEACVNSALFAVVFPLCAEGASEAGIGQGVAMGALGTIWAAGAFAAPVGAAKLAEVTSDGVAFLVVVWLALPCLAVAAGWSARSRLARA